MKQNIISGMRPTGKLHLGHYHGVLKNLLELQNNYQCYFMVADWHALTTAYEDVSIIGQSVWDMVIDWLAAGIDPEKAVIFIQSRVEQHAQLHLALSMMTPLSWLERVPTYKDQITKLSQKDLGTYGFLGYPVLMSADILLYRARQIPVGEDQIPHVEITRELARRFNFMYGREANFAELAAQSMKKMGKSAKDFERRRNAYLQNGDNQALEEARQLLANSANLADADRQRLLAHLENKGKAILLEPEALLTKESKMPGLDGQKMSKSYGNAIAIRESPEMVNKKIRAMPTDPARVRRSDAGNPAKCPVWALHKVYTDSATHEWLQKGCASASIGCLECKQPVIDAVLLEQQPMFERAQLYVNNPKLLREIVEHGNCRARECAQKTMDEVREAMGLNY